MARLFCAAALVIVSLVAYADDKTELQNLYAAMNALTQEQQSIFQQLQMLQELRRSNDRSFAASLLQPSQYAGEVPNYEDLVQQQRDIARRGQEMARQSDQLYAQYSDITAKKAQLQERVLELVLSRQNVTGAR